MLTRRKFLANGGILAAAALITPSCAFAIDKKAVGLQLYSLRDEISKNVAGVLAQVAKAGFGEVETYGFSKKDQFWGLSPKEFKALLDKNGLKTPSGHYGLGSYLADGNTDELKEAIKAAKTLGAKYITAPWIDEGLRKSADDYKVIAKRLNDAGKLCAQEGVKLAYHNHDFEFQSFGNTTGYDILLKETDKSLVDFEMDLYWVVRSGNDPIRLFKEHSGRFTMWHVKDMDKANPELNTTVGTGSIDFKAIFAEAKLSGMKHFFIEHENNYVPSAIGTLTASCTYIKKNLL